MGLFAQINLLFYPILAVYCWEPARMLIGVKRGGNMKRILLIFAVLICVCTALFACTGNNLSTSGSAPSAMLLTDTPKNRAVDAQAVAAVSGDADPAAALDAIYADLSVKKLKDADSQDLKTFFQLDTSMLESFHVRYTSGKYGLSNVFILKPKSGYADDIKVQLQTIQENLMEEFKQFDVNNSYSIAQSAEIYNHGDYVIMLMLADNEAAREILDAYLPLR